MEKFVNYRPKTFVSMDSLWYEEERLATFIDWPISYISPADLAKDGFYYLRTKDHCACAFCRGVIGKWERGDTPITEHKKHFPECAFVLGKVTPNVPLQQGDVLSRIAEVSFDTKTTSGIDICGFGKADEVLQKSLISNSSDPDVTISSLGLRQYCGPKRKEYLTCEVRLRTFKNWPERVTQKPAELAEAGFYYCGLSDHVRCFHCGNGLRNWEPDDKPWEEHARWFPDCHFVFLKKGIDFIDKVRREKPPYYKKPPVPNGMNETCMVSTKRSLHLTDDDMDKLMELHIMKHVLEMGFSEQVVKTALRNRLEETGQPFFSLRTCIDAIILIMEKESKTAGNGNNGREDVTSLRANTFQQEANASASEPGNSRSSSGQMPSSSAGISQPLMPVMVSTNSISQLHGTTMDITSFPPLPNANIIPLSANSSSTSSSNPSPLPTFTILSRASPPLRSSTPTDTIGSSQNVMSIPISENEDVSSSTNRNTNDESFAGEDIPPAPRIQSREDDQSSDVGLNETTIPSEVVPLISEADVIMKEAAKLLSSPSTSLEPSSNVSSNQDYCEGEKNSSVPTLTLSEKLEDKGTLEQELERIREKRMCRVCMDKEMDVVFLPCTHMVTCSSCAVALTACPICRRVINYAFKPIIS